MRLALESVGNLRLKSSSAVSKSIEVYYDRPSGCFDQLVLICEMISTNEQRVFVNSNVCHDLPVGQFYRISVQTQREGWQSISSTFLQVHLQSTSELIVETNTSNSFFLSAWTSAIGLFIVDQHRLMSILVPSIIGIFVLLLLVFFLTLLVVYRQRRRQHSSSTDGELVQSTKINHILQQVNMSVMTIVLQERCLSFFFIRYSTTIESYLNRPVRIRDLPREYERLTADRCFHLNEEFNVCVSFGKIKRDLFVCRNSTRPVQQHWHALRVNTEERIVIKIFVLVRICDECHLLRLIFHLDDHSRVRLTTIDPSDSDYINANFISVSPTRESISLFSFHSGFESFSRIHRLSSALEKHLERSLANDLGTESVDDCDAHQSGRTWQR